ncbi:MAG: serine dehydratase subunit alpha family protein [Acholeplasmatales bacterium]|nr:MAG: serine dehydratase subunit alpha family protein [Acholeplasmatales bacterium]
MQKTDRTYQIYLSILKEEMQSASGCTEPGALAFAAAKAQSLLPGVADAIAVRVSGNVMKNAKSVHVPNAGGLKGIRAALVAGVLFGQYEKGLEVILSMPDHAKKHIEAYLKTHSVTVSASPSPYVLDIDVTLTKGQHSARIRIINHHTNIVLAEQDGQVLLAKDYVADQAVDDHLKQDLTVEDIVAFADHVDIEDVRNLLDTQIANNMAIAEEGLAQDYGANVGSVLLKAYGSHVANQAKAYAAAASDARMSGSKLPVTIVAGSGNQGLTASLPIIVYARHHQISRERLYRALVVGNLVSIHQKRDIGSLSAYCGVVFAGAGSGAGITYLFGGDYNAIAHTIVNALAILSGMICDGAKPSCAAKIAMAVEAGILGHHMYENGQEFLGGDGIIAKGIEATLANVTRLAREGMRITDEEIMRIMHETPHPQEDV